MANLVILAALLLLEAGYKNFRNTLYNIRQICIRRAFRYAERPYRFIYGSDWPLAPMPAYAAFIREAIPDEFHAMVFAENARNLFGERMRD